MAEEGTTGVGVGQAADGEVELVELTGLPNDQLFLHFLRRHVASFESGECEITSYVWEQDFGSREVEGGKIERFPTGKYHLKISYRRKP